MADNKLIKRLPSVMGNNPTEGKAGNTLTQFEIELLATLVKIPSYTGQTHYMARFITEFLSGLPDIQYRVIDGNIYIIKGSLEKDEYYPAVVAHTDTVHALNYNIRPYINGDVLFAVDTSTTKQYGTGGDDKVGIYIGIMALLKFEKIKVVFFRDEERGCIGSNAAHMDFFNDVGFVLQADRRGRYDITDVINSTPVLNDEFKAAFDELIKKHSRSYVTGAMTDVIALVNKGLKVCACNISCGYYDPHTSHETINLLHVQETRDFVYDLLEGVGVSNWPFPDRAAKKEKHTQAWQGRTWISEDYYDTDYPRYSRYTAPPKTTTFINENGIDFLTTPDDYCQACGEYMNAKDKSSFKGFCNKCVEDLNTSPNEKDKKDAKIP